MSGKDIMSGKDMNFVYNCPYGKTTYECQKPQKSAARMTANQERLEDMSGYSTYANKTTDENNIRTGGRKRRKSRRQRKTRRQRKSRRMR